jgi:hypothetical protein
MDTPMLVSSMGVQVFPKGYCPLASDTLRGALVAKTLATPLSRSLTVRKKYYMTFLGEFCIAVLRVSNCGLVYVITGYMVVRDWSKHRACGWGHVTTVWRPDAARKSAGEYWSNLGSDRRLGYRSIKRSS